jgi:NADH-quinone oxidoreductase subunit F
VAEQIRGKCLCALGEFSIMAVTTGMDLFKEDFAPRPVQTAADK